MSRAANEVAEKEGLTPVPAEPVNTTGSPASATAGNGDATPTVAGVPLADVNALLVAFDKPPLDATSLPATSNPVLPRRDPPKPPTLKAPILKAAAKSTTPPSGLLEGLQGKKLTKVVGDKFVSESRDLDKRGKQLSGQQLDESAIEAALASLDSASPKVPDLKALYAELKNRSQMAADGAPLMALRQKIREHILAQPDRLRAVASDPAFAGEILGAADLKTLQQLNLDKVLGPRKNDVASGALEKLSHKKPPAATAPRGEPDREAELDPAVFELLSRQVGMEVWNDKENNLGSRKRGLAAQVCNGLWNSGNYETICKLIAQGVDTTLPFQKDTDAGNQEGVWSGFVQPLEHLLGNYVRDVGALDTAGAGHGGKADDPRAKKVQGAKTILEALERRGNASVLTKWDDVEKSQLLGEFAKQPGTIWGFEDVRLPYVQAAHASDKGNQPLRMMELWTAVEETFNSDAYNKLLDTPDTAIPEFVKAGAGKLRDAVTQIQSGKEVTDPKYKFLKDIKDPDTFIRQFETDATKFLSDFSKEMPKGEFETADIAGIAKGKLMGGLACKAGLWWAKENKTPVYYCLDGIKMEEVIDYKKVKKKAIDDFVGSGLGGQGKMHYEVITLVEVRDVLKHWNELKDIVKFVDKGKILAGAAFEKQIEDWRDQMAKAKPAEKALAPPKERYKKQLDALDPALFDKIETDQDARQVVSKFGIVARMASTRPHFVLKYLMSKCAVLVKYALIPTELPGAAAAFRKAAIEGTESGNKDAVAKTAEELRAVLGKCHAALKDPLMAALLRGPLQETAAEIKRREAAAGRFG